MLKNFDSEFTDLRDYILKITHRIWEDRGVDRIREWYGTKAPVYTPLGVSRDVEDVVRSTLETLHMFPDRRLYGEDVIARDYSEGKRGLYYSSHRIFSSMTHRGDGFFGKPTGRNIQTRVIADCVCEKNLVIEEWMVRDQSSMVKGIGLDVETFGRELGRSLAKQKKILSPEEYEKRWRGGPKSGKMKGVAQQVTEMMEDLFVRGKVQHLYECHDRAASCYFPQQGFFNGIDDVVDYLISLASGFQKTRFEVQHWIVMEESQEPTRISIRWTLKGEHLGYGLYGPPSGAALTIMGISHFELRQGKIYRAFHLFDELSIWAQIEANTPVGKKNKN